MVSTAQKSAVQRELQSRGIGADEEALIQASTMCSQYRLNASDFANQWEAFCLRTKRSVSQVTSKALDDLRPTLHSKKGDERFTKRPAGSGPAVHDRDALVKAHGLGKRSANASSFDEVWNAAVDFKLEGSPTDRKRRGAGAGTDAEWTPSKSSRRETKVLTPFAKRKNAGAIVADLNKHLPMIAGKAVKEIMLSPSAPRPADRDYGDFERHRAHAADEQVEFIRDAIKSAYNIESLANATMIAQAPITICGRICCEDEGKINATAVMLESAQHDGGGKRVKLDVSSLDRALLFPGQVVAVHGLNPSGISMHVSKLVTPGLPKKLHPESLGSKIQHPVSLFFAAGPFTLRSDLQYDPLDELLKVVEAEKPGVLILAGPFVDAENTQVMSDDLKDPLPSIFRGVLERIISFAEKSESTRVVLVPSAADVAHGGRFPQPVSSAFPGMKSSDNVLFVPNPTVLSVAGLQVGICNADIVKDISSDCVYIPGQNPPQDRLATIVHAVLEQRSFYPLNPAAPTSSVSPCSPGLRMEGTPDIFLSVSDLQPFAKKLDGDVVAANPGRLARFDSGGSYAKVYVHEGDRVCESIRVDIVRI